MLQQTDVSHVLKVYDAFFEKFPNLNTLDKATKEEIEEVIKPLGFWRIRARDFKLMARHIIDKCGGTVPEDLVELEKIPGIGRYVSTAMVCFCFDQQQAIVDVNVRRVMKRVFFWETNLPNDKELEAFVARITPARKSREFNWGLLDFSASICSKKPRCDSCFASSICQYYWANSDGAENSARSSK